MLLLSFSHSISFHSHSVLYFLFLQPQSDPKKVLLEAVWAMKSAVLEQLLRDCVQERGDVLTLLKAFITSFPASSPKGMKKRVKLYETILTLIRTHLLETKILQQVQYTLTQTLESLPTSSIPYILEYVMLALEGSCNESSVHDILGAAASKERECMQQQVTFALELLPKCMYRISTTSTIEICRSDENGATMSDITTGVDYYNVIINRILAITFPRSFAAIIIASMRELSMDSRQIERTINKVRVTLKGLLIDDLPSFVYNLLLFSTKGPLAQNLILTVLVSHFDSLEAAASRTSSGEGGEGSNGHFDKLRSMIGTSLVTVSFAMKQDQPLGAQYIQLCRQNQEITMFRTALLLAIGSIHRFESDVLSTLMSSIQRVYETQDKVDGSWWLTAEQRQIKMVSVESLRNCMLQLAVNTSDGWYVITSSLIQLSLALMQLCPSSPSADLGKRTSTGSKKGSNNGSFVGGMMVLGKDILMEVFNHHSDGARGEIISQLASLIIVRSQDCSFYLTILTDLINLRPAIIMEFKSRLVPIIEGIPNFPPSVVRQLIRSLLPESLVATGSCKDALDTLSMVLRKCCFFREESVRLTAVNGFLALLAIQSKSSSSSSSTFGAVGSSEGTTDAVRSLSRCLGFQVSVRSSVYVGISALSRTIGRSNKPLSSALYDLLESQMAKYFDADLTSETPLKLRECLDSKAKGVLLEPLPQLFLALHCCSEGMPSPFSLTVITERLLSASLTDYGIDKSSTFDLDSDDGVENLAVASQLQQMYEVLISCTIVFKKVTETSCLQIMKLFQAHASLRGTVKEVLKKPTADKKGAVVPSLAPVGTALEADGIMELFNLLEKAGFTDAEDYLVQFDTNLPFKRFCISSLTAHLNKMTALVPSMDVVEVGDLVHFCVELVPLVLSLFESLNSTESASTSSKGKEDSLPLASFKCILSIFQLVSLCHQSDTVKKLSSLGHLCNSLFMCDEKFEKMIEASVYPADTPALRSISCTAARLQGLMISMIKGSTPCYKLIESIMEVHILLVHCLPKDGRVAKQHFNWIYMSLKNQTIPTVSLCNALFTQYLYLCGSEGDLSSVMTIYSSLCRVMYGERGENVIDQEGDTQVAQELQKAEAMCSINSKTTPGLLTVFFNQVSNYMEEVEWLYAQVKVSFSAVDTITMSTTTSDASQAEQIQGREMKAQLERRARLFSVLYGRMDVVARLLSAQLNYVSIGPTLDSLVNLLTRFFKVIINVIAVLLKSFESDSSIPTLKRHLTFVTSKLSLQVFQLILACEESRDIKTKKNLTKQSRIIPTLIYTMETFANSIIKLSKKSHGSVDFSKQVANKTVSRDYRLDGKILQAVIAAGEGAEGSVSAKRKKSADEDRGDDDDNHSQGNESERGNHAEEEGEGEGGRKRGKRRKSSEGGATNESDTYNSETMPLSS